MLLTGIGLQAQKEGLNWFFGNKAGLEFHEGYPKFLNGGKMQTVEGCATISDSAGNLLMYTDGRTVYDREHHVMPNGDALAGSSDATQSGIIVNVPNNPNLYYVFTTPTLGVVSTHHEFRMYTVDMDLNDGNGALLDADGILIHDQSTERVTAVQHKNKFGVWVIMHEWESSRFFAYLIKPSGIDLNNPVISDVGIYQGYDTVNLSRAGIGYMKLSPDGSKLAIAISGLDLVEIYDFSDSTGVLSNPLALPFTDQPYGVEFSSNAEYLYATERDGLHVFQWDMMAGSDQQIIDSRIAVGTFSSIHGGALQMASDGKIYIARLSKAHLSVINQPGLPGMECDFEEIGVTLPGPLCQEGLPTFIQSYFNNVWIINKESCINESFKFYTNVLANIDSIFWDFGVGQITSDTAWGDTVTFLFPSAGSYLVTARVYHVGDYTELTYPVDVLALPHVELGDDVRICRGDTQTFYAGNQFQGYQWNGNPQLNLPYLKVSEQQKVFVDVSNSCGTDSDTVELFIQELPEIDLGPDTAIQFHETMLLDAGDDYTSYQWQDGSDGNQYLITVPGNYWVDVADDLGCKTSDTVKVGPIQFEISVPTAFSPNGDQINDEFRVYTNYEVEDLKFELQVFNRYGENVFSAHNLNESWDGSYLGVPCQMDVYTWYLKASSEFHNEFFPGQWFQTGTLSLLR